MTVSPVVIVVSFKVMRFAPSLKWVGVRQAWCSSRFGGCRKFDVLLTTDEWFTRKDRINFESSAPGRRLLMSRASTRKAETDIPVLKREQLGKGVRGKYFRQFSQGSNVVVLQPEIFKAFPTSEAVNQALASLLTVTRETVRITSRSGARPKRAGEAAKATKRALFRKLVRKSSRRPRIRDRSRRHRQMKA